MPEKALINQAGSIGVPKPRIRRFTAHISKRRDCHKPPSPAAIPRLGGSRRQSSNNLSSVSNGGQLHLRTLAKCHLRQNVRFVIRHLEWRSAKPDPAPLHNRSIGPRPSYCVFKLTTTACASAIARLGGLRMEVLT